MDPSVDPPPGGPNTLKPSGRLVFFKILNPPKIEGPIGQRENSEMGDVPISDGKKSQTQKILDGPSTDRPVVQYWS